MASRQERAGEALLVLVGGIDSPVAGWMAMRKGLTLEAIHFHSYPYTSERAKEKVMSLAHQLAGYTRFLETSFGVVHGRTDVDSSRVSR